MNINEIKEKKKRLISLSNPEWQEIVNLQLSVQNDFQNKKSLSIPTYHKVLDWKLQKQKSQIEKIISGSPDSLIKTITFCYNKTDHPNSELNIKIKMHVLLSIPWIGIGIASAIMALHEPQLYGTIDLRSWSNLFHEDRKTFSMNHYMKYLGSIRELANQAECDVQEIDYILWKQYEG